MHASIPAQKSGLVQLLFQFLLLSLKLQTWKETQAGGETVFCVSLAGVFLQAAY